tara:strand:- start:395 stop:808 length:414 start_codon:yes stop_codon:yes gene_type:complete
MNKKKNKKMFGTTRNRDNMHSICFDIQDQEYWMDSAEYHEHIILKAHYLGCAQIEERWALDICEKIVNLEDLVERLEIKARNTQDNIFTLANIMIVEDRIKELEIEAKKHDRKKRNYLHSIADLKKPEPPIFEINPN